MNHITTEHRQILLECHRRMQRLAEAAAPAESQIWATAAYLEEIEHGPRFSCDEWFGKTSENERARIQQALLDLEVSGLLIVHQGNDQRVNNIKLSPLGEQVAG